MVAAAAFGSRTTPMVMMDGDNNGDEDDVVTMSDYYADYAKALETMLEQPDEEDFINDGEISIEDIQNE